MEQSKKVEETKVTPAQVFAEAYNKLVEKHGFQLLASPAYKARDDGTFSTVIQMQVAQLPKAE